MMKKVITIVWLVIVAVFVIQGCTKDTTVVIPLNQVVTTTVSFKSDIIPILTKNCALGGCHATGGHAPVLTSQLAYNSLINGSFIDMKTPENSIIYERLTGKVPPAMPIGRPANPSNIEGLILAWIKQGAKDN